jgi:hypothetical protein
MYATNRQNHAVDQILVESPAEMSFRPDPGSGLTHIKFMRGAPGLPCEPAPDVVRGVGKLTVMP